MSQADSVDTIDPSKISSDDVGGCRVPTELQIAFAVLKADIGWLEQPSERRFDVTDWADHLDEVLGAAFAYARAVASHLTDITAGHFQGETAGLADAISDMVGALHDADRPVGRAA